MKFLQKSKYTTHAVITVAIMDDSVRTGILGPNLQAKGSSLLNPRRCEEVLRNAPDLASTPRM